MIRAAPEAWYCSRRKALSRSAEPAHFPIFRHSQISYAASLTYDYIDMLLYQPSFIDVVAGAAVVLYGRYPTLGDNHGTARADARWPNRFREDGGGKCTWLS